MKYLGIEPIRPKVAVFDFTGCEGCELQLANKEDTLVPFINTIEIVNFREISSAKSDEYDIALVEGSITRKDEIERIKKIRSCAKVLIALGSCACFGGVNRIKNNYDLKEANEEVYGKNHKETEFTRAIKEVVDVDYEIPGCPISKVELERIVQHLLFKLPFRYPVYPVCVECKQKFTTCLFEFGQLCLGPITRAGCDAPCPAGGLGCLGCRGPAEDCNFSEFLRVADSQGHSGEEIKEKLGFFGGFEGLT